MYVNQASKESKLTSEYGCALTHLRELLSESDEIKCCFFRSIQFYDGLSNDLWGVYREIIAVSFSQNCQVLDSLDYFWHTQIDHGNYENVIQEFEEEDVNSRDCDNRFGIGFNCHNDCDYCEFA